MAKFTSHDAAAQADREYYWSLTPQERLDILYKLQEAYRDGHPQGFERVYKITRFGEGHRDK